MPDYPPLSRDELLRLALERDQLTDEAQLSLDAELPRRGFSESDFRIFKAEEATAIRQTHKKLKGHKNYSYDPRFCMEEFDTTMWVIAFWIPVILLASSRLRREVSRWWNVCASDQYQVIERRPGDGEQILVRWIKTAAVLLVIRLTLPFFLRRWCIADSVAAFGSRPGLCANKTLASLK